MTSTFTAGIEDIEVALLLDGIARRYGYDFRDYAPACLRRRIRRALAAEALGSVSALQGRILREPECMERFVANLSVPVTAMFRDPELYLVLRREVVPVLRTYPFIRIWHAGCATGEEVYSMAIMLQEEGLYERCRLYATDLSAEALACARRGVFPLRRMRANTLNYLRAGGKREFSAYYTADSERAMFSSSLRRHMVFSQHNLVSDGPFNEFNLVMCRNVLIYFNGELRDRVHRLLHDSLCRLGLLVLGSKETLDGSKIVDRYRAIDPEVRLYRKEW